MKGGRARTVRAVSVELWGRVPFPKSAFVRDALAAYLASRPSESLGLRSRRPDGRFEVETTEVERQAVGMYVQDDLYNAVATLPGSISAHFEAALKRALEERDV